MSFSLSSLLNPAPPDADRRSPEQARRQSLPPLQHVQSPEQQHYTASIPQSATMPHLQHGYPPTTAHEAAQALAAQSASVSPPTQWGGFGLPESPMDSRRGSVYGASVELPQPMPDARKMSSPTLDQYHVASRSPQQQRRASAMGSGGAGSGGFTLPPIQSFDVAQGGQERRQVERAETGRKQEQQERVPSPFEQTRAQVDASSATHSHSHPTQHVPGEPAKSEQREASPPPQLSVAEASPATIKHEPDATPLMSFPADAARRHSAQPPNMDPHTFKAVSSLKNEHGLRNSSPLRDCATPMPTTEASAASPPPTNPKKRPAKKGTASAMKKPPPSKKRKVDPLSKVQASTPTSRASKTPALKSGRASSNATPANSSPAPSTRRSPSCSAGPGEDDDDDDDDDDNGGAGPDADVYCICRKPDHGTFMIGCDGTCDDWFHGKCVGIAEADKGLIDRFICPDCKKGGLGSTTFKAVCRRQGCRLPARVGRGKGSSRDGSKYCSDDCGVAYFREMVARTRGRDPGPARKGKRANSTVSATSAADDLGARGGALAAGELKALVASSKHSDGFKRLGAGVLSPPPTPDGEQAALSSAEAAQLALILAAKAHARRRHQLLKDRAAFVALARHAAARVAAEKDVKPKDLCGYDERLAWGEEQFGAWRQSAAGRAAFQPGPDGDSAMDAADAAEPEMCYVCSRRKCARHYDWAKLASDDLRCEMRDNGERMRALEREERSGRARAAVRARLAGGEARGGDVEIHGLGAGDGDAEAGLEGAVAAAAAAGGVGVEV